MSAVNIPEDEVLAVLDAVDRGEVTTLEADRTACEAGYCGDFWFTLSNGWRVAIYNDCNEWDYVSHVVAADGRECRPWEGVFTPAPLPPEYERVRDWKPSGYESAMRAWGITE